MKLQAFDSKRRLTNICCFVVGLGLVKLVFGAYILAGGTLFSFESVKRPADPKAEALAKAREQQRLALKKPIRKSLFLKKLTRPQTVRFPTARRSHQKIKPLPQSTIKTKQKPVISPTTPTA